MLFGDWSFRVSVLYASWRGGRRCNDVAMEDKIEVTLHVIGISPFSNCRQFTLILVIYSRDVTHIIYMHGSVTKPVPEDFSLNTA